MTDVNEQSQQIKPDAEIIREMLLHSQHSAAMVDGSPSFFNPALDALDRLEGQHALLFAALTAIQQAAGVEHRAEDFESFAHATATAALNGVRGD